MIPIVDYHMHTPLCGHAVGEPLEYAEAAIEIGLEEIGFSDHDPVVHYEDPGITMKRENMTEDDRRLRELGFLGGDDENRSMAERLGMRIYPDLTSFELSHKLISKIPYSFVKKHMLLPIKEEEGKIIVAVSDPLKLEPIEELRHLLDKDVEAVYCPKESIL